MNILILSPYYAPCSLVGAARMTSLSEYLSKSNKVDVICFNRDYYKNIDGKRNIPDGVVIIEVNKGRNGYIQSYKETLKNRLADKIYDVCIMSMGPFEGQRFVWKECKKKEIQLILDYRDPWLFYPPFYKGKNLLTRLKLFIKDIGNFLYEIRSIEYSSLVVTVTDRNTDILRRRYKKHSNKIKTVYNGYESSALSCISQKSENTDEKVYSIGCAGKFLYYNKKFARLLIEILDELYREKYKIKLYHIGEKKDDATQIIKNMNLVTCVYEYGGKLDYDAAMRYLAEKDAGLIIYGTPEGLGTKVFDYIGLNKPIIYYGILPSELGDFINGFKNVVVTDNKENLKEGIKRLINSNVFNLEDIPNVRYSRDYQNSRYEELIQNILVKH